MRVLVLTPRFPYPPLRGDQVRAYHFIRVLARRHRVVLVCFADPAPDTEALRVVGDHCERLIVVPHPRLRRMTAVLQAPLRRLPLQVALLRSGTMERAVAEVTTSWRPDVALVQLVRMGPYRATLGPLPAVLDMVDALSLNMARRAARERGPLAALTALEARLLRRYEREVGEQFRAVVTVSGADGDALGLAADAVVPNGVDVGHFAYREPVGRSREVVCVGNMGYFPNVEGVTWFAREVLPLVRDELPDLRLTVVGARPAAAVARLADISGVTVTGRVADVVPHLHRAAVAIAPLRSGTGLQNKVLEALSAGTPMVATSHAVAGVAAVHGRHLVVADDADGMADAIASLIRSPLRGIALAREGRQLVAQRYSWEAATERLESHLMVAAGRR